MGRTNLAPSVRMRQSGHSLVGGCRRINLILQPIRLWKYLGRHQQANSCGACSWGPNLYSSYILSRIKTANAYYIHIIRPAMICARVLRMHTRKTSTPLLSHPFMRLALSQFVNCEIGTDSPARRRACVSRAHRSLRKIIPTGQVSQNAHNSHI